MRNISIIILTSLFLLINISSVIPQSGNNGKKIERISLEKGFSNDLVYCICQDSRGFIWFGTMFGLVRFDGVNYKTYRNDPLDSNTLSNDDIISIFEDRNGNMWFGTYNGGLNKYERDSGKFIRYIHDAGNANSIGSNTVWEICQDKDGTMWFATEGGGLNRFENGMFYSYKKDTLNSYGTISGNFIQSVAADKEGNIWAGTFATGLNKLDKVKNTFTNYRNDSDNATSLSNNFVTSIFTDSKGQFWLGTGGGGINKFDPIEGKFKSFKNDQNDPNSISSNFINSISENPPGVLLIATQNGLNKFDISNGKFEKISLDPLKSSGNENVTAFIKDKSGVIWVSSYNEGLYKIQYPPEKFKSMLSGNNIKCIFEDRAGRLWIGTAGDGLLMSEDNGKNFISVLIKKNAALVSISNNKVNSIAEDNNNNIWVGTENGLIKLDKTGRYLYKLINDPKNETSVNSNRILKILCDRSGELWIGTDRGLNEFDPTKESFTHYKNSVTETNILSDNAILSIYEDKYGIIWTGTYFGLNKLDKSTGKFTYYKNNPDDLKSISNNYVYSFCEDSNNNFWIGTGGGLNIFDRNTETFYHFTESNGLPNGVIAGIESGNDGYLWISTFRGISRLSVKETQFRNYDSEDGLLSNMFNTGSYFKNSKGEILFGSANGVNFFKPEDVSDSRFTASVILTTLTSYDDKNIKETDISSRNEIQLNYKENFIRIGFAATDYSNPLKNKFKYRLTGFDNDWKSTGWEAVYTNLDPGEYIFKVKGTNSDGVWNEQETSLRITVIPPFWKTWWFYGILMCLSIAAIIIVQNYKISSKVKYFLEMEKIREKEREIMREQASRDYHDELGHKLTRISLYSRRINKKLRPTANGLTDDLNSIVETSNSLQSGAKDLIWAMNPQEDSLYDFMVRLRDFGNELFENTGINFSSDGINDEFKSIQLSMNCKRHLIYIFKEGMNNILKYSRCKNVNLNFRIYGDDLEILLKDDGKGFDMNNCPKGYGLKNIYSRARQIDVNVNILSEENSGTEIKLTTKIPNLILN
ncbi:MAG TPA: two-component regulator propeller domain-containing protein [Ignavibacteria bacterium]|nr:two-component regulator propeller domain-containing protein [Ignavibacteria bacterium]